MATVPAPVSFIPARIDSRLPTDQRDNEIRSVPELVEYNARHNPKHIFCGQAGKKVQVGSTGRDLLEITHVQLKNAILKCSRLVVARISELQQPHRDGESGDIVKCPPVALFMESDIGILIHLFSFLSLGIPVRKRIALKSELIHQLICQVVLLSARLSPTAVAHLLSQTSATAVIAAPTLKSTAKEALSILKVTEGTGPSLYSPNSYEFYLDNDLIQSNDNICDPSHYISKYDRNVLMLHSSGTTGLPKPIYISHDCLLGYSTCHDFQNVAEAAGLNATTLPLYHVSYVGPFLGFQD
jgi:acyl-CoA synthetase (AMP-forming)/AMP-acid ligase II